LVIYKSSNSSAVNPRSVSIDAFSSAFVALVQIVGSNALAFTGEQYLSETKVPLAHARKLALKTYPGRTAVKRSDEEIERRARSCNGAMS
jgi:hypothetical protein